MTCLSDETLKAESLLSGVYARGSKISHQSALECVTVVDSTSHSKSPMCDYAALDAALHNIEKKKNKFTEPIQRTRIMTSDFVPQSMNHDFLPPNHQCGSPIVVSLFAFRNLHCSRGQRL